MNIFTLAGLLVGLLCLSLAITIIFSRLSKIYFLLFLFNIAVAIWGLGCFVVGIANQETNALQGWSMAHVGGVFISVLFYHLICQFCEVRRPVILIAGYIQAIVSIYLIFVSHSILTKTRYVYGIYYNDATPLYVIPIVAYVTLVLASFFELFLCLKKAVGEKKIQTLRIILGFLFGFVGGTTILLPSYGIDLFYPIGNFGICIYALTIGYALFRRQIFDLEQIAQTFQREKLATIGLIAASINHEIRNPLYAVKGLLETYLEYEKEGIQRKAPKEVSEKALKQVTRALEVIGKLNHFAKPVGESSLAQEASISEAIQTVLDLVANEFELDRIHIKNQIDQNIPKIQVDQRQLEEILFNLIVNACQAMKDGGELVIAASCHSERSEESMHRSFANAQDDKIVITIQDTGTGISPEQARYLFEPFHTTKGDKGTGLGLYITKQMVERNGGKITVKNHEGKGTTFYLEFNMLQK